MDNLAQVLSVSALTRSTRELLQRNFPLLWVAGEVSNLARAASGHVYFSLKDDSAQVRCVMFRNRAQLLPWQMDNGQQVEVHALVTLFEARGDFQLNIEAVRRAGIGARYEAYTRLCAKLEREGLFALQRKRPLPRFPRRIGIVTSAQAAALQDVLSTLRRRAAHLPLYLYAVPVQGEGAAEKIAAALGRAAAEADATRIDVLILVRGGGSIEDLWAFNEEVVARAISASPLPVVSGVGHETDLTVADLAADQRAATPTAAAELVSAGWFVAAQQLTLAGAALRASLRGQIDGRMQRLDLLAHRLVHPQARIAASQQSVAHLSTRLLSALVRRLRQEDSAVERLRARVARARPMTLAQRARVELLQQRLLAAARRRLAQRGGRITELAAALSQLSPQATLARGYSIVRDSRGAVVRSGAQLSDGEMLDLNFANGWARARVSETG